MNVRGLLGRRKFFLQYRLNQASSRLTCCVCWVLIAAKNRTGLHNRKHFLPLPKWTWRLQSCCSCSSPQRLRFSASTTLAFGFSISCWHPHCYKVVAEHSYVVPEVNFVCDSLDETMSHGMTSGNLTPSSGLQERKQRLLIRFLDVHIRIGTQKLH